ncbi:MAG: phosphate ABC transporter substrate-binding protein [Treponema sp.]|nr:phosphate ABC transporter substrate-binding protein [Treponema sp.]
MKKFLFVFLSFALVAGIAFAGGGSQSSSQPASQSASQTHTISVGGSTSVAPLMELFQAEYEKANSGVKITISGTGSGDGIKGAGEGTYEIGMSSRELTPAEIGAGLDPHVVAIDGIAVIVNNGSPLSGLTMAQIKDIYTGAITRWEQLGAAAGGKTGGIAVVSREPGSGTRGAFQELIGFNDGALVQNAIIFDGTGAIKSAVAGNADAIGYISLGSVDTTAKALSVDGVAATNDNVKAGTYRIARPFILITKKGVTLHPAAAAFLSWTMDAGQSIVQRSWISIK